MNISKLIKPLSILTALLTVLVYVDTAFLTQSYFLIMPVAVLSAIVTIIFALIKRDYLHVLLNVIYGVVAFAALLVFPW